MKIKRIFFISFLFIALLFNNITINLASANRIVYLGGMPAGFSVSTRGAYVIGLCDVITEKGVKSPSKDANLRVGDYILSIDGVEVNNALDIEKEMKNTLTKILKILRNNVTLTLNIKPEEDLNKQIKIGVFIRDNINGIGTITYISNNKFASLGHPIINENGTMVNIIGGTLKKCEISGVIKGVRGKAGGLKGVFTKDKINCPIIKNTECGVYGEINEDFTKNFKLTPIEIGTATIGPATIFTTIENNKTKEYNISIIKYDEFNLNNRNFVIRIDDEELIEKTGGIVQGMSGSPIVQNGKLVGAVTHVFINDPTRGFGIDINKMLEN
ncbi:MAG: SpoIVB peptidase [Clostridia bacterium]|nr:SpoIVB peptidase [Clostridia bacterium]